jgi:hypothetical protein
VTEYLFSNFRTSRLEYEELSEFWNSHVWKQLPMALRSGWTTPWFATRKPALQDGNPIFTAWSEAELRGLQIIQVAPDEGTLSDLNLWLDWFGDLRDPEAIRKLVITCVLTSANLPRIQSVIEQWVIDGFVSEHSEPVDMTTTSSDASDLTSGVPLVGLSL